MDTSSGDSKIGEVSVRAYFMGEHDLQCYADYGINGLTGAVATSNFDSAGKTWVASPTARIGDMLCIRDRSAGMSVVNGFYLVNGITNDTRLTVNHAWIAGEDAKAALEYIIWRYIPEVDPMAEFIMHWAPLLLPFNMDVVYADPTP
jgi:hypothetical protein